LVYSIHDSTAEVAIQKMIDFSQRMKNEEKRRRKRYDDDDFVIWYWDDLQSLSESCCISQLLLGVYFPYIVRELLAAALWFVRKLTL
jgi:hypothetical protein